MTYALLAEILLLGHLAAAPELAQQLERAFEEAGRPVSVAAITDSSGLARSGSGAAHVILAPSAAPLAPAEAAALQGEARAVQSALPEAKLWVFESWPQGPVTASWVQQADSGWRDWQGFAAALGPQVQVIPAATAVARLAAKIGAEQLGDASGPDDRAHYQAVLVTAAALGLAPEAVPERLVRRWMRRDSVVRAPLAAEARAMALQVLAEKAAAAPAPSPLAETPPAGGPGPEEEAVPALAGVGVRGPGLGFSLAPLVDWSVQQPFLDVMKIARPWQGVQNGKWGAMSFEALLEGGYLDAAGWPKALPPGMELVSLVLTDLPQSGGGYAGRYRVSWEGEGRLSLSGRAQKVETAADGLWFDFRPGEGGVVLHLTATSPADPLRNIRVLRADRIAQAEAGAVFNPDFLARLRGSEVIRFMDWMQANNTLISEAAERPLPGDFTYAWRGAPVEVMVALANELAAEPWFNMPWLAGSELNQSYARHVQAALRPELRAWIEYTNEAWNFMFPQTSGLQAEARARWGDERSWMQLYGLRAAEMVRAWDQVFGAGDPRLVRVLSSQTGWPGLEADLLSAPLVVAEGQPRPVTFFDAWAVTAYFSAGVGHQEAAPLLQSWLAQGRAAAEAEALQRGLNGAAREAFVAAHRFDAALLPALEDLRDGRHSGEVNSSLKGLFGELLPYHARVAAQNGLDLVMYEGGTHVVGHGPQMEDAELTAFFTALNYSAGMGELYRELLSGWRALTPAPFVAYVDVMAPSRYGSWGALRHLWDDNPRWQALTDGAP